MRKKDMDGEILEILKKTESKRDYVNDVFQLIYYMIWIVAIIGIGVFIANLFS
jgi:hypothetical protein